MTWEVKKLGDVCELITDGVHNSPPYVDIGIPMLDSKHIDNSFQIDDSNPTKFISEETDQLLSQRCKPKENDILISSRGSIGKIAIVRKGQNFNIMGNIILLRLPKSLDKKFIVYSLHSELKNIESIAKGVAQKGLYLNQIRNFPIPLPPLPKQKRIVAILDESFESISKAKENAEKNLKNAKEIFESYLQNVFENKGEGGEGKKIHEITKVINGYSFNSKDFSSKNVIKSVKITNVGVKEFIEETDNYLPEKCKETLKEFQVKEGNIVIALTRTIIAAGLKVAVVPKSYDGALLNQRVAALIPNDKSINQQYLYHFLCTDTVIKYVTTNVKTLMQPNLSINDLKNLIVPCPSLSEQQSIVTKLDAISQETKRLKAIYEKKLADLDELKKSILQKAFEGALT